MHRVLIVDDNRILGDNLGEILSDEGYETIVFDDPVRALLFARREPFAAVVTDLRMPRMDGVSLQLELETLNPTAAFVIMTAYDGNGRTTWAKQRGVTVVGKPVPPEDLVSTLKAACPPTAATHAPSDASHEYASGEPASWEPG